MGDILKMLRNILKNVQKTSASVLMRLCELWQGKWGSKWKIGHKDTIWVGLTLNIYKIILNIKCVSV